MEKKSFGQALRNERERHGMTAEGFSAAIGLDFEKYSAIERGEELPSLELARDIADALGVPLDTLTKHQYVSEYRMKCEDGVTEEEKAAMEAAMEELSVDRYNRGRTIITAILIVHAIFIGLNLLLNFFNLGTIIGAVFNIVMLICLYNGKTWARVVFIILSVIGIISDICVLLAVTATPLFYFLAGSLTIFRIASCILLCASSSVEEFLYEQSTN